MSKDSEGLELEEVLKDIDVPTAGYQYWVGGKNQDYGLNPHLTSREKDAKMLGDDIKRLVTREDHEEALEEAVQKAVEETKSQKEMEITQLILQAEQKGLISAGQAQQINDLREQHEEEVITSEC